MQQTPDLSDTERYISLETFRRSGDGVRTPVWFAVADGTLYVFTNDASGKVKRLRHTGRVRVAPCDVRGRVHGEWRAGRARFVDDPTERRNGYVALARKYGRQYRLLTLGARLSGSYRHRVLLAVTLDDGQGEG